MPASTIDYSDQYLYWDNTEHATVVLKQVWDSESDSYEEKTFEDVIVKRVQMADEEIQAAGVYARSVQAAFLVPAELIDGGPIKDGDTVDVGFESWTVVGTVQRVIAGGSMSHYRCVCYEQRG